MARGKGKEDRGKTENHKNKKTAEQVRRAIAPYKPKPKKPDPPKAA